VPSAVRGLYPRHKEGPNGRSTQALNARCSVSVGNTLGFERSTRDVTGSIQGVVRDRTQGAIAGVRITVTNTQTNFRQETNSGSDGSYRLLALPAGTYKLNATGTGFQQFSTTDIEVKVNDQLQIDITLQVGSVQQEISVVANAVQVEAESTQLGDVIDSKKMLSLRSMAAATSTFWACRRESCRSPLARCSRTGLFREFCPLAIFL